VSEAARRALGVFPGGIANGEFGLPPDQLVVMARGEGCRLWDTDDSEYLDFSIGWGSCLPGHAHPAIVAAVRAQAALGSNFAYANTQSLELAEEIQRISPAAERLRFCASGTEAVMYCLRLARAWTGKPKVLKFEGAYHGAVSEGVTSLFPSQLGDFPQPELTSAGTPNVGNELLVAPYNDVSATEIIVREHATELAGVIVEPLHRCTPPNPGFLESLRELCTASGVLLIFDELVTGFRLAYGGAQEYSGVVPDLVAYGKAFGGGYPIGAFAGRADILERVDESRIGQPEYVWMASTLGGNPVCTAAANAALALYRSPGTYRRLHALGEYFRAALRETLQRRTANAQVIGDGPLAQILFTAEPVFDYRSAYRANRKVARALMLGLFERRVFLNPMGTKLYLSLAHDEAVCDVFCERLDDTLERVLRTTRV